MVGSQPITTWSRKHEHCVACGKTEFKHQANGLCEPCYYKDYLQKNKDKYKEASRKWQLKNKDKLNEYKRSWNYNRKLKAQS